MKKLICACFVLLSIWWFSVGIVGLPVAISTQEYDMAVRSVFCLLGSTYLGIQAFREGLK